jgi:hypothetical protein
MRVYERRGSKGKGERAGEKRGEKGEVKRAEVDSRGEGRMLRVLIKCFTMLYHIFINTE